ncbi:CD3e molecule, epsilon associated protein isoform X2 [Thalassophryne amazonica]|uniref:CD3e molecule, epsilon associated protein isoform X2 n=1 Tax=Thalassophryne amazonica TaxID=390379 RepID=UPI0014724CC5|nr:CD3e molecule, epsilon associated protein isoform X2 [Thalassophryne amazonica]
MPRDVSSSSGDEAGGASTVSLRHAGTSRYQCPADFVPFCHEPCSSMLTHSLNSSNREIWLIQAPAVFNPQSFTGVKVPLSGLETLQVPAAEDGAKNGNGQQIYRVSASPCGASELHLLTRSQKSSDALIVGPAFSGLIKVCESYGDTDAHQVPQVIRAASVPALPPGLKQRFHPFGIKTPTLSCGATSGTSSAALPPVAVKGSAIVPGQQEEMRKKKKKEKQIKAEEEEGAVRVKEEPGVEAESQGGVIVEIQEGGASEEGMKKKKKKKKRRKEEEAEQLGLQVKEEMVPVKCEPMDTLYGDVIKGSGKTKKKKSRSCDDE